MFMHTIVHVCWKQGHTCVHASSQHKLQVILMLVLMLMLKHNGNGISEAVEPAGLVGEAREVTS